MSESSTSPHERLLDLIADRATQGLSRDEQGEFDRLLNTFPEEDPWSLELVAAAADESLADAPREPLPAALKAKVEIDAVGWLAQRKGFAVAPAGAAAPGTPPPAPAPAPPPPPVAGTVGRAFWPWLVAAAGIILAVIAWWPRPATTPPGPITDGPQQIAADLDALLEDPATQQYAWTDAAGIGATGTVIWNNARQAGYLRLTNLKVNDPTQLQYQLWIFDAKRNPDFNAVDGGVFDVTKSGEVIVRIEPKLDVFEPALFAITTEPPGGVVKHDPGLDPDKYYIALTAEVTQG